MIEAIQLAFAAAVERVFIGLVQPLLYSLGWMSYDEMAYEWTSLFLVGLIEVTLLWALIRPLEKLAPAEHWPDRKATRVDVLYTLLVRLGILPIAFFLLLTPLFDYFEGHLRLQGIIPPNLEDLLPFLAWHPLLPLAAYLLVADLADYWRHRFEHRFQFWWALHSVHHSQRQMTFWTDEREHLLDLLFASVFRALIGIGIGIPPASFVMVTLFTGAVESFSHANVRVSFGRVGDRLLVSPLYHRTHHAIRVGHTGSKYGCNFAAVLPLWDVVFGTANFTREYLPTGIEDQLEGRDYGQGFWRQQWLGLRRMFRPAAGT
jgi:sterol desaturase/sphingolipid hydroxylase (fatty acid hydroxylase superfamily)